MEQFAISCTPEQTRKALELGAPIGKCAKINNNPNRTVKGWCDTEDGYWLLIPTSEQMCGWLRTKECTPYIYPVQRDGKHVLSARLCIPNGGGSIDTFCGYGEDNSIILAAIDAALEYLTNNKK